MASLPASDPPQRYDWAGTLDDELMTGEAVGLDLRPTGFVLRGAGAAIDFIAYLLLWIASIFAVTSPLVSGLFEEGMTQALVIVTLVLCVVVVPAIVELSTQGKSLGKLAIGARIVRDDGGAIGLRHAAIRALFGVMEIFMTLGGLAALIGLLNSKSKRLGDLLAGTYSQNERLPVAEPLVFGVPTPLMEWSQTADVARMPDGLARRIAQFLRSASRLTPETRWRVARDLATEATPFVSPIPPADPELFLAAVAAVRREREFTALQGEKLRLQRLEPVLSGLPHGFPERDAPAP